MDSPDTAIILLAAGHSSRMGAAKQLLEFRGKPMVRHAAETALSSQCGPVVVVAGAYVDEVRNALEGLPVIVDVNSNWPAGIGGSIQTGLAALPEESGAAILALADQPLLTAAIYNTLLDRHRVTGRPIVAAAYAGTVGVPVLFSRSHFPHLMALQPDQGCKGVIVKHKDDAELIPCPEAEADVDTTADYQRIRALTA